MYKVCVDTGGTFTDCMVMDEDNNIHEFKAPTTPGRFHEGVLNSIAYGAESFGLSLQEFLQQTEYIIHGTTVATNALVEHTTAKTAMITTSGFRDIIEMRQCNKIATHSIFEGYIPPYTPYVPRRHRYTVTERTRPNGEVMTAASTDDLDRVIEQIKAEGIEAVAVCFINSFRNPENENAAVAYCKQRLPGVYITNSADVLPNMGEYERFSTCVISACLGPIVEEYLTNLEKSLKDLGFNGQLLIVPSNQYVQSVPSIIYMPVYLSNSGPSAGPVGAVKLSETIPERNYLIGDMGGTTWDASLVADAKVSQASSTWLGDDLIGIKMAEVLSIGAGGGSIAWINPMGLLNVGPRSASAMPGPACYQRGGTEPTVTDAALILGYINPDNFNGGKLKLSKTLAREAINKVAEPLGLSVEEAAQAIFTTVNHNMADGISVISTRKGYDIRDFSLLAVGGGGPLCGVSVANVLGMKRCIVPKFAAAFCAKSMFYLDIGRDYVRSYIRDFDNIDPEEIGELLEDMKAEAAKDFEYFGIKPEELIFEKTADVHYANQYHELELKLPEGKLTRAEIETMKAGFHQLHKDTFTFSLPWVPIQIINVRMTARYAGDPVKVNKIPAGTGDASAFRTVRRGAYG
ncbi:MAG: hydantoinase/oxoprolinase family protein, partial [Oscillospiraceae bacterium]|nr:hydantoinase/oxoprolinase family protein [Oscillospiraceae bacterium]